ncbi:MAG TPA: beta-N-acetylhexosaminidase [Chthoniobacteraceae bacterium]|nr:beta-N-acetylhexosaminidase [Chthoniobacteraceae bacterium]
MRATLLPKPRSLQERAGVFVLTNATSLIVHHCFQPQADLLADRVRTATGLPLPIEVVNDPPGKEEPRKAPRSGLGPLVPAASGFTPDHFNRGHLCLVKDSSLDEEGYYVEVHPWGVRLMASTPRGMAHAVHSFFQLCPPAIFSRGPRIGIAWSLPCIQIKDSPQCRWRGIMLDCARHFIPVPILKRFIDLFALHHYNVVQLHLNDDQGWRVEVKALPKLTELAAVRKGTQRGHQRAGGGVEAIPHRGFYTQAQLRDLVSFAEVRGIALVPEIAFPGHCTAFLAAYPHLASGEPPSTPACEFGILPHALFPSEENLEFIAPAYEEVMNLFPAPYLHIGGDELLLERWNNDPRTPDLLHRLRLAEVSELQPWFTRHLHALAARHGKRIIGWDEIHDERLPGDAILSVRGRLLPEALAKHEIILASNTHTYFDHYQSSAMEEEPLAIEGVTTLETVYRFRPLAKLQEGDPSHLLGVQGHLWSEYLPDRQALEYMGFPRSCALAEAGWSSPELRDWDDFTHRLSRHLKRLDVLGVAYRKDCR